MQVFNPSELSSSISTFISVQSTHSCSHCTSMWLIFLSLCKTSCSFIAFMRGQSLARLNKGVINFSSDNLSLLAVDLIKYWLYALSPSITSSSVIPSSSSLSSRASSSWALVAVPRSQSRFPSLAPPGVSPPWATTPSFSASLPSCSNLKPCIGSGASLEAAAAVRIVLLAPIAGRAMVLDRLLRSLWGGKVTLSRLCARSMLVIDLPKSEVRNIALQKFVSLSSCALCMNPSMMDKNFIIAGNQLCCALQWQWCAQSIS